MFCPCVGTLPATSGLVEPTDRFNPNTLRRMARNINCAARLVERKRLFSDCVLTTTCFKLYKRSSKSPVRRFVLRYPPSHDLHRTVSKDVWTHQEIDQDEKRAILTPCILCSATLMEKNKSVGGGGAQLCQGYIHRMLEWNARKIRH
ncbi:hypothetical protein BaRGS_00008477 [Batillaria attramentaria]|uniref:Uncharacterized protein n=1 Tax=Batillaria attramentaria TaxID=370345 RepID=A0ABD0LL41_9CAEN